MNTSEDRSEVRKILDKIKAEYNIGSQNGAQTEGGATEFVFEEEAPRGLVFEEVVTETPASTDAPTYEFKFFDASMEGEQYDMPKPEEEMPRIYHTYVPRFTGASDKFRVAPSKKAEEPTPEPSVKAATAERVSELPADEDEEFSAYEGAKLVNISEGNAKEEKSEILSVKRELNFEAKPTPERTLEDEEADIRELMAREESLEENTEEPTAPTADAVAELPDPTPEPTLPDPIEETYILEDEALPPDAYTPVSEGKNARRAEYTSPAQRMSFKDKFLDTLMSMKVRLCAAGVLTVLLLVFENLRLLGIDLGALMPLYALPGALALVEAQFVICLFALTVPELFHFVKSLAKGRAEGGLLYVLAFLVTLLYCLSMAVLKPTAYTLLGSLFGIFTVAHLLASYLYESAAFMSFKLISIGGVKHAVEKRLTRTLEEENMALDGAVDEYSSYTANTVATSFVSDFFRRSSKTANNTKGNLICCAIALGVALTAGVVAYFVPGGAVNAITTFTVVFLLSVPVFVLLLQKLPFYYAQRLALSEDSTFLGERAMKEHAAVDVVTFSDSEIFGAEDVALKRIILYDDKRNFTKALRQMSSLFASVGGPLSEIFSSALDRKVPPPATGIFIERDGVYGDVEGVCVCAGSEEYMRQKGILIPTDDARGKGDSLSTMKVMYAAEEGKIYAKFHIRYSFSEEFTMLLPHLKEAGIVSLVYTADPNIDSELLGTLTTGEDTVRVMKRTKPAAQERTHSSVSAGIVTLGDKTNAINMILLAKRYAKFFTRLSTLATLALASGALLAVALSLFVSTNLPTIALAVWQLLWIGVCFIWSERTFRE